MTQARNPSSANAEAPLPWSERRGTGLDALFHRLDATTRQRVLDLTRQRRHVRRNEALYVAGTPVTLLFVVESGSVKAAVGLPDGRRQLVGYHIVGDLVGLAGLASGQHADDAFAAEPTDVALLPYAEIARLARADPQLGSNLTRLLAVTSGLGRPVMLQLATDSARARVAGFLLVIAERYARRARARDHFVLPLTNQEIGSLIGLTGETVSRVLAAFGRERVVLRERKHVAIVDERKLQQIAAQSLLVAPRASTDRPR